MVTIRPTAEETNCCKLAQLVLNSMQRQACLVGQLTHIVLLRRRAEQQLQQLRPDFGKQDAHHCPF